jgi:4-amino-4-deoxy-L-arabinose transferase-like glycosyltransferase
MFSRTSLPHTLAAADDRSALMSWLSRHVWLLLAVLGFLCVGIWYALYPIGGGYPDWADSGFAAAQQFDRFLPWHMTATGTARSSQPLLYQYVLGAIFAVFGISESSIRFLNLALGALTLVACYAAFTRLAGRAVAAVAVWILALAPATYVTFVTQGNYDSMVPPFAALAVALALGTDARRGATLSIGVYALAVLAKLSAVAVAAPLAYLYLTRLDHRRGRLVPLLFLVAWPLMVVAVLQATASVAGVVGPFDNSTYRTALAGGGPLAPEFWRRVWRGMQGDYGLPLLVAGAIAAALFGNRYRVMASWLTSVLLVTLGSGYLALFLRDTYPIVLSLAFFVAVALVSTVRAALAWRAHRPTGAVLARSVGAAVAAVLALAVLPLWARSAPEQIGSPITSGLMPEMAAYMARTLPLAPDDALLVGYGPDDPIRFAFDLAAAGVRTPRPYYGIVAAADPDEFERTTTPAGGVYERRRTVAEYRPPVLTPDLITPDNLSRLGVRYVVLSSQRTTADPAVDRAVQETFGVVASAADGAGRVAVYDPARPSATPRVELWRYEIDSLTPWSGTNGEVALAPGAAPGGRTAVRLSMPDARPGAYQGARMIFARPLDWTAATRLEFDLRANIASRDLELALVVLTSADGRTRQYGLTFPADVWTTVAVDPQRPAYDYGLDLARVAAIDLVFTPRRPDALDVAVAHFGAVSRLPGDPSAYLLRERPRSLTGWEGRNTALALVPSATGARVQATAERAAPGTYYGAALALPAPADWSRAGTIALDLGSNLVAADLEVALVTLAAADGTARQWVVELPGDGSGLVLFDAHRGSYDHGLNLGRVSHVQVLVAPRTPVPRLELTIGAIDVARR